MINFSKKSLALIIPIANKQHEKLLLASLVPVLSQSSNLGVFIIKNYPEQIDHTVKQVIQLYSNDYHRHNIRIVTHEDDDSLGAIVAEIFKNKELLDYSYVWKFDCDMVVPTNILEPVSQFTYRFSSDTLLFNLYDVFPITKGQSVFPITGIHNDQPLLQNYAPQSSYEVIPLEDVFDNPNLVTGTFIIPTVFISKALIEDLTALEKGQRGTDNIILKHMGRKKWLYPANIQHIGCIFYNQHDYAEGSDYLGSHWTKGYNK